MLTLTSEQLAALAQRRVVRRLFLYFEALTPDGTAPSPAGFWDDVGDVVVDGKTYYGRGSLITVSTLNAQSSLAIPGITITLSGVETAAKALIRSANVAQKPITVSLGIFDPDSRALVGGLIRRFVGVVDTVDVTTPAAGDKSTIVISCESSSRALTVKRTETRSSASLKQRNLFDKFYDYTAGQKEQTVYFGRRGP